MYNDNLEERYQLACERINEIVSEMNTENECKMDAQFQDYFGRTAKFIVDVQRHAQELLNKEEKNWSLKKISEVNQNLYKDVTGNHYNFSYANPAYAVSVMGEEYGRILSFLYMEERALICYAYEQRIFDMTVTMELFIEIFCIFEAEKRPSSKELYEVLYWYISDYSDITVERRIAEMLDSNLTFATDIVMKSDLNDLRYLYQYGEYITENEQKTAAFLNGLSQDEIEKMASTFTEGFRIGFILGNKNLAIKKTVNIRYCVGFERLVREEIKLFEQMGLKPTIYRAAVNSINKTQNKTGYYSTSPNKQMDYDHRFDSALYMDAAFIERKLGAVRLAYEKYRKEAGEFAGPAVMEIFGEHPFEPEDKKEALKLDEKQQKLAVKYANEASRIVNEYIKGEERSFTIIAYPVPEIGNQFEEIFKETVKINTLDYNEYKDIQQSIIDALDGADYVEVKGQNGNCTDIRVSLMQMSDSTKQTVFENCLADVNIPLGEVFTSPVLKGTSGILNVSEVFLHELNYKNLRLTIQDGMVVDYTCDNFTEEARNKEYIKSNLLYNHDTLPIGEFAIGTNTTAYVMANAFDIVYKLPILIVEKMGPHFAVGDTCYTWSEDVVVFNPNGKEIIAKDNEISLLRKTEPEKAYFNCHTDITIPYDEIGEISAGHKDGSRKEIIKNGRFILQGALALNIPFENK